MPEIHQDPLFILVQSLSTSESRHFKLYVNRIGINEEAKFLMLFDELKRMKSYDEAQILAKNISTKKQLSNLKAHLYKEILVSLRLKPSFQNNRLQIREQLDFATILYQKGLHKQALKILDKAKHTAFDLDEKTLSMEIIDLEKVIESQFITRSIQGRADQLISESEKLNQEHDYATLLSNLSLKLYSEMLTNGYAQTEWDKRNILDLFNRAIKPVLGAHLNFAGELWLYKAHVWKSLLLQDYKFAYKYAQKWVQLFYDHPEMIQNHPVWYIKGNTNLLKILFLTAKTKQLRYWFDLFRETTEQPPFRTVENLQALVFLLYYNTLLNIHLVAGDFYAGTKLIPEVEWKSKRYRDKIDIHHFNILKLKIASICFGAQDYQKAIAFCHEIMETKSVSVQEELLFHTRILMLMSMFESGADIDYDEFSAETRSFVDQMKRRTELHSYIIEFLIELGNLFPDQINSKFKSFYKSLCTFEKDPYQRRTLYYLDLKSWAFAKATNQNVADVISKKLSTEI